MRAALFGTAMMVFCGAAYADDTSTGMIEACRLDAGRAESSAMEWYTGGRCLGFVFGFAEGMRVGENVVCIPQSVTAGQLVAVYVKWANDHPNQWHLPEPATVYAALAQAFPCPKK